MDAFFGIVAFVLGAIVGSFLNVVIYRLHTGKSLNGRSHCLSCGAGLMWLELFPLFSYLALRARCRHCSAKIPSRYALVEALTGLSFLLIWYLFSSNVFFLVFYLVLISILIVIAVYDLRHTIIPDEMVIFLGALSFVYVGHALYVSRDIKVLLWGALGAFMSALFFAGLWYISRGKWMGLGDAKLALPLGFIVGFPEAYSMVVFAFLLGAVVSLLILALQWFLKKGKTFLRYSGIPLTMKSEVPFAPFLIVAFLLVEFFHADIFQITFQLLWLS